MNSGYLGVPTLELAIEIQNASPHGDASSFYMTGRAVAQRVMEGKDPNWMS